jgi:heat shock protein HtpX
MSADIRLPANRRSRALVAIGLVVGFYTLSVLVTGVLLFIAYESALNGRGPGLKVALLCLIAAGTILLSIVPRKESFVTPGPVIGPADAPGLFHQIQQVAKASYQPLPGEVYLLREMNAWVAHRGGFMGWGSRPVMAIGLPLLYCLSSSELRSVLAHEFGHYYAADTKLAIWVYQTHVAIARTLQNLHERDSHLLFLFEWYGNLYLRVSRSISREQEFAADALAARLAGPKAVIGGLQSLQRNELATELYWSQEVQPVLEAGFVPPISAGFPMYLAAPSMQGIAALRLSDTDQSDPSDTHPPLQQRIAALEKLSDADSVLEERPASELVANLPELERRLAQFLTSASLRPIDWSNVGPHVYPPKWRSVVHRHKRALAGLSLGSVPQAISDLPSFSNQFLDPPGILLNREQRKSMAVSVVGVALALVLYETGWQLNALPGYLEFQRNEQKVEPFTFVASLASGETTPEQWQAFCNEAGITEMQLVRPEKAASAS